MSPRPRPQPAPVAADPHSHGDRAASFDRGAEAYAQVRPAYPREAIEWLLPAWPAGPTGPAVGRRRVLDLAAGTGKLTQGVVALLDDTADVVAVEPSPAMLAELTARLPGVEPHLGAAERIPLGDASVDAVLVGQAWHWFDADAAAAEIARVLRPGGTLGVLWNIRDDATDWVARFGAILHAGDRLDPTGDRRLLGLGEQLGPVETRAVAWTDRVRTGSLRHLAATRSYVLTLPDADREALLAEVDALVATHPALAGRTEVDLPYVTHAFRAVRA